MVVSILAMAGGVILFGAGGWWLYGGKGAGPVVGLLAQAVGMCLGLAGLLTLVLPDFFG
jgi:hypothetical protein